MTTKMIPDVPNAVIGYQRQANSMGDVPQPHEGSQSATRKPLLAGEKMNPWQPTLLQAPRTESRFNSCRVSPRSFRALSETINRIRHQQGSYDQYAHNAFIYDPLRLSRIA